MYNLTYKQETEFHQDNFQTLKECYERIEMLSKMNIGFKCFAISSLEEELEETAEETIED